MGALTLFVMAGCEPDLMAPDLGLAPSAAVQPVLITVRTATNQTVNEGDTLRLQIVLTKNHPKHGPQPVEGTYEYTSSNTAVVQIDTRGIALARSAGKATLTVSAKGVSQSLVVSVLAVTAPVATAPVEPAPTEPVDSTAYEPSPEEPEDSVPATPLPDEPIDTVPTAPVEPAPVEPAPLPAPDGEFVVYPSAEIGFLMGPQLKAESSANPWGWFDRNAAARGLVHGENLTVDTYYDHALAQYLNYYRTRDARFLTIAQRVADTQTARAMGYGTNIAPRSTAMGSILARALELRETDPARSDAIFSWATTYLRHHDYSWISRHYGKTELWYGVRDGGYVALYLTQLAKVHPNATIRAEMLERARKAYHLYFMPLQWADGGWYWKSDAVGSGTVYFSQPFQVGIMLEGMVAYHQLTGDATVRASFLRAVDWLWARAYRQDTTGGCAWRSMGYWAYPDQAPRGGTDCTATYSIHEQRQLNPTTVHAFGYAYQLTKDAKYLQWGDEVFAAAFGRNDGPLADSKTSLAFYQAKEYNQNYRSAGRYLAWRTAR